MKTSVQHILSSNVRALRRERGLSKVEFCLQANISRVLLDLIENGRSNLKLSTLEQIANAFGVEPWELLK